jgi:hypothetical protein
MRSTAERLTTIRERAQNLINRAKTDQQFVTDLTTLANEAFAESVGLGTDDNPLSQEFWQTFAGAGRGLNTLVALDEDDTIGNTDCKTTTCLFLEEIFNLANPPASSASRRPSAKKSSAAKKNLAAKKSTGAKRTPESKKSAMVKKAGSAKKAGTQKKIGSAKKTAGATKSAKNKKTK